MSQVPLQRSSTQTQLLKLTHSVTIGLADSPQQQTRNNAAARIKPDTHGLTERLIS